MSKNINLTWFYNSRNKMILRIRKYNKQLINHRCNWCSQSYQLVLPRSYKAFHHNYRVQETMFKTIKNVKLFQSKSLKRSLKWQIIPTSITITTKRKWDLTRPEPPHPPNLEVTSRKSNVRKCNNTITECSWGKISLVVQRAKMELNKNVQLIWVGKNRHVS